MKGARWCCRAAAVTLKSDVIAVYKAQLKPQGEKREVRSENLSAPNPNSSVRNLHHQLSSEWNDQYSVAMLNCWLKLNQKMKMKNQHTLSE
ncbi:hypothetical protein PIB30_043796, partial [Stylosanthes scabra]|nr:hypothetical protein [Stylosanthes scabra]